MGAHKSTMAADGPTAGLDGNSAQWNALSADEKMKRLWSRIVADPTPKPWLTTMETAVGVFLHSVNPPFDHAGEEMPLSSGGCPRLKSLHQQGSIAQCEWRSLPGTHDYTGVFAGSKHVLVRCSFATDPEVGNADGPSLTSGVSIKVLRSGAPSGNILLLHSLLPKKSSNYFANDFTNHLGEVTMTQWQTPTNIKALIAKFNTVTSLPDSGAKLSSADVAEYTHGGAKLADPQFPFRVQLHAPRELREVFDAKDPKPKDPTFLTKWLAELPIGTVLFQVFVQATPFSSELTGPIGEIVLKTKLVPSFYADDTLFFKHDFALTKDVSYRPEWLEAAKAIVRSQCELTQQFEYPNIVD